MRQRAINVRQSRACILQTASMSVKSPSDAKAAELEAQADHHFASRNYHDALACQLQAIDIRKGDENWSGAGNGAQNAGLLCFLMADHAGAIQWYKEALELRRRTNDLRGQAVTLGRMGEVFQQIGQHAKAVELLECSVRLFARVNATRDIGTALNNMAVSYREMGGIDKAMQCHERSREIRRQVGDLEGLAATLHNLSVLYSDQSHDDKARLLLVEARDLREAMGDIRGMGQTILRLGTLHEKRGDNLSAIECYEHALSLARQEGVQSKDDEAAALLNLADALSNEGAVERSLAMLDDAERLFVETGMNAGVAMTHYGRGRTLAAAGRGSEALACFEEAKSHFTMLNDEPRLISAFVAIGTILSGRRLPQEARDAFSSALELQTRLSLYRDAVATLQLIARECEALGDATGALNAAQAAAVMFSKTVGNPDLSDLADGQTPDARMGHDVSWDVDPVRSSWPCSLH
ncbi:Photosystem I assembly protein Ycf3 [Burkholderia lata]|uniref:Photosystem I assembly protein Ycf3 n=2 Tax=Burkholderia lata (strain ATCC 17760 / DSM 23089 / LMG 22485 / NCIMB 9086 / R18194 / 383) TaxID=482957 RepID=A0A6P2SMQ1_BURL3|nr:Photosystem I assembly protein Ycf3 [Burkholderia lata]